MFNLKSLKAKIILPVLLVAVIGLSSISAAGYFIADRIIRQNIEEVSESIANKVATHIDSHLEEWMKELEILASDGEIASMDFQVFHTYLTQRKNIFSDFEMFLLADLQGNFKATVGNDGNISDRAYFKEALKGSPVVSEPVLSRATGKPIIVVAAPVRNASGAIVGVTAGTVELSSLTQIINEEKHGETGYAFMLDKQSMIIAHPAADKILKEKLSESKSDTLAQVAKRMVSGEADSGYYTYEGVHKVTGFAPVKSSGWSVAFTMNYDEASHELVNLRTSTALIAAIILVLLTLIIFLVVGHSLRPVIKMAALTDRVAEGDLTVKINAKGRDEIAILAGNFNRMVSKMRSVLTELNDAGITVASSSEEMMASCEEVSKASEQIAMAVADLARGATEQALSTEDSSRTIMGIMEGLGTVAADMTESEKLASKALESVSAGEELVGYQEARMTENKQISAKVGTAVTSLAEKSKEIGQIIEVIRGIADQTNLLSLNAAIEAARAGEQGRGFSIVAEEVRKLAEQSGTSVKRISEIIREVQEGVEHTVHEIRLSQNALQEQEKALSQTVKAFREISGSVDTISGSIKAASKTANHLSAQAAQAGDSVRSISGFSQEIAAGTEEVSASTEEQTSVMQQVTASAEDLAKLAFNLQQSLKRFKLQEEDIG